MLSTTTKAMCGLNIMTNKINIRSEDFVLEKASGNPWIEPFVVNNTEIYQNGYENWMSAYMLVYIKKSEIDKIITPFLYKDVPPIYLRIREQNEYLYRVLKQRIERSKMEIALYLSSHEMIFGWSSINVIPSDKQISEEPPFYENPWRRIKHVAKKNTTAYNLWSELTKCNH